MSDNSLDFSNPEFVPLAARARPRNLNDYVGQTHLIGEGKPLRKALLAGHIYSMIFWGPPGVGKTTLVEIIARDIQAGVERISAVTDGIKEIRLAIEKAKQNKLLNQKTILFVDEVHRFNKSQQDAFLPYIEDGTIIFIGATTENPSFELNNALLSRLKVYILQPLTSQEIIQVIKQALEFEGHSRLKIQEGILEYLAEHSQGDARLALNNLELMLEMAEDSEDGKILNQELLTSVLGQKQQRFDKEGDYYYQLISALHKSVRGSAPDAALYWYARIITAGGDPLYVARRLLAIASEDIGNADPRAMQIALSAWDCYTRVGAAEGERAIAQAIIYLAVAPKSNAVYTAFNLAKKHALETSQYDVPLHLRNAPTSLMRDLDYGKEYRYAHNEENAYAAGESFFPEQIADTQYYEPSPRGLEIKIKEKLESLKQLDAQSLNQRYKK